MNMGDKVMKRCLLVLWLLCLPRAAFTQKLPDVTAEGKKAAVELLAMCEKVGALKVVMHPVTKARRSGRSKCAAGKTLRKTTARMSTLLRSRGRVARSGSAGVARS